MAYADIGDFAALDRLDDTDLDQIRANFQAGVPDIFTTEGDIAIATGADAAARLAVGAADSVLVAGAARPEWQIAPAVHLTKSDSTSMDASVWTAIEFDTETSDTDAMHEGVTNPSRITIPTDGDGWYIFGFFGTKTGNSPDKWMARVLLNGTTTIGQGAVSTYETASLSLSAAYPLSAADYIEVQYYTPDGSGTLSASPMFWAIWQRRQ